MTQTLATQAPATDKQIAFIVKLRKERDLHPQPQSFDGMTKHFASATITALLTIPVVKAQMPVQAPAEPLTAGMYRKADGTIYRVYKAQHGNHLLAKRLTQVGGMYDFKFVYAGGARSLVTLAERMTLDEVKGFGMETGTCCVCSRVLTVKESVEAGIGPVCAGKV